MGKLGERLLLDGNFTNEDITGPDEPPVDSPRVPRESTSDQTSRTQRRRINGSGARRTEMNARKKTNCHYGPTNRTAFQCYHRYWTTYKRQRERTTREDESMGLKTPPSPVAQNEALELNPVSFDMETRHDDADVPLPEEPVEMSGDQPQGWITEEAFFTVSQGSKNEPSDTAERCEFLRSMDTEWQTFFKNQITKVLYLEETARARERWPDRAKDARWARIWKPDDSKPSGRQAKARLIIKGFTDPDLLDIESHSPTLPRGFMTVLQSICSRGHKLQFCAASFQHW